MRRSVTFTAAALCLGLVACGEKPQTAGKRKADQSAYATAAGAYTAGDWKAGDSAGWELQLTRRAQNGQNEYTRASAP